MRETPDAREAFLIYRDMGPGRSLQKLAEELRTRWVQNGRKASIRLATLGQWSSAHGWQERIKEYDTEQANLRRSEQIRREQEEEEKQEAQRREDEDAVHTMLLGHVRGNIEPSSTSQIQAAKLLMENFVFADRLKKMEAQQNVIMEEIKKLGVNP